MKFEWRTYINEGMVYEKDCCEVVSKPVIVNGELEFVNLDVTVKTYKKEDIHSLKIEPLNTMKSKLFSGRIPIRTMDNETLYAEKKERT